MALSIPPSHSYRSPIPQEIFSKRSAGCLRNLRSWCRGQTRTTFVACPRARQRKRPPRAAEASSGCPRPPPTPTSADTKALGGASSDFGAESLEILVTVGVDGVREEDHVSVVVGV